MIATLVVVRYVTGFSEPDVQQFSEETRVIIERGGGSIVTAAHALGGFGSTVKNKFNTIEVDGVVVEVLRLFSRSLKVAYEISCMSGDAGLIRTDEDVIAIGGSGHGADAALFLRPTNTHTFFNLAIREIICKPRM